MTLQQTGAVAQSNANGLFAFFNVPVADGGNTFTVIATNAAGLTSQYTRIITRVQPGLSLTPPVVTASLADDTGVSALDNITSDDTVTGTITTVNPIASFQAQIDQSPVVSVLGDLSGTTFTLTPSIMATINGGPLADGKHTLTLLATDSNGNLATPVTLSFILDTTPPAPVTPVLLASSDTGISDSDGITRLDRADLRGRRPGRLDRPALLGWQPGGPGDRQRRPGLHHHLGAAAGHAPDHRDSRGRRRQRQQPRRRPSRS